MKKNLKGSLLGICVMLLFVFTGCKKLEDDNKKPVDFDVTNKIFRVHTTTDTSTPYNITITQQGSGAANNVIDVKQNNGGDFNYGFTPQVGSTISVKVQADKVINCYVFYNGTSFGAIEMKAVTGGKFEGEFSKQITE